MNINNKIKNKVEKSVKKLLIKNLVLYIAGNIYTLYR